VIETETVNTLSTLFTEVETPVDVRFSGAKHGGAILGPICYGHVWDWSSGRVKDNTFEFLSGLGLFDNYELP